MSAKAIRTPTVTVYIHGLGGLNAEQQVREQAARVESWRSASASDRPGGAVWYPPGVKSSSNGSKRRGIPRARVARPRGGTRQPSARLSRVESAYQAIRRRILDNEYPQGHHVREQELAAELGMSRTPIREALVRLEHEGLVQLIPRHGMRVVPLPVDDLRDMYEVLTALELTAIERTGSGRASTPSSCSRSTGSRGCSYSSILSR